VGGLPVGGWVCERRGADGADCSPCRVAKLQGARLQVVQHLGQACSAKSDVIDPLQPRRGVQARSADSQLTWAEAQRLFYEPNARIPGQGDGQEDYEQNRHRPFAIQLRLRGRGHRCTHCGRHCGSMMLNACQLSAQRYRLEGRQAAASLRGSRALTSVLTRPACV